jgi:hypothetical protein
MYPFIGVSAQGLVARPSILFRAPSLSAQRQPGGTRPSEDLEPKPLPRASAGRFGGIESIQRCQKMLRHAILPVPFKYALSHRIELWNRIDETAGEVFLRTISVSRHQTGKALVRGEPELHYSKPGSTVHSIL